MAAAVLAFSARGLVVNFMPPRGEMLRLHRSVMPLVHGTGLISAHRAGFLLQGEDKKVKTMIIALSAAALIAAAPAGFAEAVPGKTPGLQHKVSKKHHARASSSASLRAMQAKGSAKGYPRAFGSEGGEPAGLDRETEMSRKAGGGGGM